VKAALWAIGVALAIFVGVGIYLAGFYPAISPKGNGPLLFGAGTLYGRRISTSSWQASYDSITANADQSILELNGVHDGVLDREGKPYLGVSAKHVTVNMQSHDFTATGGIHIKAVASDTPVRSFDAEEISWSNVLQRLTIVGRLKIDTGAAEPLVVDGLTFDVKTGQLHLGAIAGAANFK